MLLPFGLASDQVKELKLAQATAQVVLFALSLNQHVVLAKLLEFSSAFYQVLALVMSQESYEDLMPNQVEQARVLAPILSFPVALPKVLAASPLL